MGKKKEFCLVQWVITWLVDIYRVILKEQTNVSHLIRKSRKNNNKKRETEVDVQQ